MSDWNQIEDNTMHVLRIAKALYKKHISHDVDLLDEIFAIQYHALDLMCGSNIRQSDIVFAYYTDILDEHTTFELLCEDDEVIDEVLSKMPEVYISER